MRKLIVHEFMSLDGVMQAPGGADEDRDGGFQYGGWTQPYWHDDIGMMFGKLMQDVDAFLLGRRTYVTHAVRKLKSEPGKNIVTDGSSQLVHAMVADDLVDELHLTLYPVSLGGGKKVLPDGVHKAFKLVSATPYPTGVVGLHYNRA